MSKERLISYIKQIVEGLEKFNWTEEQAFGNMLIHLESGGYLVKDKEYYIKTIKQFTPSKSKAKSEESQ